MMFSIDDSQDDNLTTKTNSNITQPTQNISPSVSSKHVIIVSDARKIGPEALPRYSYKITSQFVFSENEQKPHVVERKEEDFEWLHNQLKKAHIGVIIPYLPDKTSGRVNDQILQAQYKKHSNFLLEICEHQVLSQNPDFKIFLTQPQIAQQIQEVSQSQKKSWFGMIKDLQVTAQINLAQGGWIRQDTSLPPDVQCSEMRAYLDGLENQLLTTQDFGKKISIQHKQLAATISKFALSTSLLGSCETDSQFLGNGMGKLANVNDKLSHIYMKHSDNENELLDGELEHCIRLTRAAKEAIKGRENALLSHHAALINRDEKKVKLAKSKQLDPPSPQKVAEAETELQQAEVEVVKTHDFHEVVSEITRKEMFRFQNEKAKHFQSIAIQYVKINVEFAEYVQKEWTEILPTIDPPKPQ